MEGRGDEMQGKKIEDQLFEDIVASNNAVGSDLDCPPEQVSSGKQS